MRKLIFRVGRLSRVFTLEVVDGRVADLELKRSCLGGLNGGPHRRVKAHQLVLGMSQID